MPSIRKRANSNALMYRFRDDEGREHQRTVSLGPARTLAGGRRHFERVIDAARAEIAALQSKHSRRHPHKPLPAFMTFHSESTIASAQERLAYIERAEQELQ